MTSVDALGCEDQERADARGRKRHKSSKHGEWSERICRGGETFWNITAVRYVFLDVYSFSVLVFLGFTVMFLSHRQLLASQVSLGWGSSLWPFTEVQELWNINSYFLLFCACILHLESSVSELTNHLLCFTMFMAWFSCLFCRMMIIYVEISDALYALNVFSGLFTDSWSMRKMFSQVSRFAQEMIIKLAEAEFVLMCLINIWLTK